MKLPLETSKMTKIYLKTLRAASKHLKLTKAIFK